MFTPSDWRKLVIELPKTVAMKFIAALLITLNALLTFAQAGSLDPTFGNSGIVITDIAPGDEHINAIVIQDDGKIIAAGANYGSTYNFAVARYNADGSLDLSFDADGMVITDVGTTN